MPVIQRPCCPQTASEIRLLGQAEKQAFDNVLESHFRGAQILVADYAFSERRKGAAAPEFDDDPVISDRFILRGSDTDATRRFFTAPTRPSFSGNKREALFCDGLNGRSLYYINGSLDSAEVELSIDEAKTLFNALSNAPEDHGSV